MKHGIYVIYDSVAEESGPMFEAVNNGIAIRQTCNVLKPLPESILKHYSLIKIGEYDTKDMQIFILPPQTIDYVSVLEELCEKEFKSLKVVNHE